MWIASPVQGGKEEGTEARRRGPASAIRRKLRVGHRLPQPLPKGAGIPPRYGSGPASPRQGVPPLLVELQDRRRMSRVVNTGRSRGRGDEALPGTPEAAPGVPPPPQDLLSPAAARPCPSSPSQDHGGPTATITASLAGIQGTVRGRRSGADPSKEAPTAGPGVPRPGSEEEPVGEGC